MKVQSDERKPVPRWHPHVAVCKSCQPSSAPFVLDPDSWTTPPVDQLVHEVHCGILKLQQLAEDDSVFHI